MRRVKKPQPAPQSWQQAGIRRRPQALGPEGRRRIRHLSLSRGGVCAAFVRDPAAHPRGLYAMLALRLATRCRCKRRRRVRIDGSCRRVEFGDGAGERKTQAGARTRA